MIWDHSKHVTVDLFKNHMNSERVIVLVIDFILSYL
jgi:hypothetical protein